MRAPRYPYDSTTPPVAITENLISMFEQLAKDRLTVRIIIISVWIIISATTI